MVTSPCGSLVFLLLVDKRNGLCFVVYSILKRSILSWSWIDADQQLIDTLASSLSSSVTIPFLSERQRALKLLLYFYRGIAVSHKSLRAVFRVMFLFCFVHLFMFYSFVNTSKIPRSPKWSYCQVIVLFNSYIRLNQKRHLCSDLFRIKCDWSNLQ